MNAYRNIINGFGMKEVARPVYFPHATLGVGHAEQSSPMPRVVLYPKSNLTPTIEAIHDIEKASIDGQGNPVRPELFGQDFYLGNPTEGI